MARSVDFTNVKEGNFKLVDEGTYEAFVFEVNEKTSSAGNDMDEVILKIADGEFKGSQFWYYLVYTEKALFKVRDFIVACGGTPPKAKGQIELSQYIGKKVLIEVEHEEYQGKMKAKVADVKLLEGDAAIDEDDLPI